MQQIFTTAAALLTAAALAGCAADDQNRAAGSDPVDDLYGDVMTKAQQDALTPRQAYDDLRAGNRRFTRADDITYDYLTQAEATGRDGQFPKAFVLSCVDSRVPVETVFDQGIGDLFVGRVAGNFENTDILGSMEFATAAAGTPLIVVLGHSACGAVKGAADGVELGNLTELLDELEPSVEQARERFGSRADSSNDRFVARITEINVRRTMQDIMDRSPVIADLVRSGDVMIVGGVYDLQSGNVDWMSETISN